MVNVRQERICIIGCGTYGAYLLRRLVEEYRGKADIIVIELGNNSIVDEKQAGLLSVSENSHAAKNGRYFGLGGTSARWGGQVLFFDQRDNPQNDDLWNSIIEMNTRNKKRVIKQLFGSDDILPLLDKNNTGLFKSGIWMKYSKRNLFNLLTKKDLDGVQMVKESRVVDFDISEGKIHAVTCRNLAGDTQQIVADQFYLTAGAIESCRMLLDIAAKGRFVPGKDLGKNAGDHVSIELFKVFDAAPFLFGVNMVPALHKGSLITKRLIVQTEDGRIGYVHPIFNKKIRIFSVLKQLLFGKQKLSASFTEIFAGLFFLIKFGFNIVFLRRMYVDKSEWSLQLDIEQPYPNGHSIQLLDQKDKFDVQGVKINWSADQQDIGFMLEVSQRISALLETEKLKFETLQHVNVGTTKLEDTYHPVGFMRMGQDENAVTDLECKVTGLDNLFHFSTALFPSAKSINPSGAVFCLIEEHLSRCF
jgi:hypothetical protein